MDLRATAVVCLLAAVRRRMADAQLWVGEWVCRGRVVVECRWMESREKNGKDATWFWHV